MKKKVIRIGLLMAVIALAIYFGRSVLQPAPKTEHVYPGYCEGGLVYISSPIGGEFVQLPVRRGDQVKNEGFL